jgi:hypothetical protein
MAIEDTNWTVGTSPITDPAELRRVKEWLREFACDSEWVVCPTCGWQGDYRQCDVLGADDGRGFCPVCMAEFSIEDLTD